MWEAAFGGFKRLGVGLRGLEEGFQIDSWRSVDKASVEGGLRG